MSNPRRKHPQPAPGKKNSLPPSTPYSLLLLFLLALLPRLFGLDQFLTSDENTNIFYAGSDVIAAFLRGDWRGTYWHFYPGVTISWLDALGMGGQYFVDALRGVPVPAFEEYIYGEILSLIVANRLPYAILSAAAVPAIYFLATKLFPHWVALLGALFLAFDPFYLAHSRVAHGDAPVAVFMTISALSFFVYVQHKNGFHRNGGAASLFHTLRQTVNPYLVISAVFGGLSALTKAPGQFMAVFIVMMSAIYIALEIWQHRGSATSPDATRNTLSRWLAVIIVWGLISLITFILLWPSMWADPVDTMRQMLDETFGKVEEGHLVYFFGRPTLDPGLWFYLYVIPFRMTPITVIGVLLSLFLFAPQIRKPAGIDLPPANAKTPLSPLFLLWFFAITLLLFGNLSPKKQDRYLLPLFPLLNLLAAAGWVGTINLALFFLSRKIRGQGQISSLLLHPFSFILPILMIYIIPVFTCYPYYLACFNPLMGGPKRAAETTLMGWGEGMEQVAAYLNAKPNAENLVVASTPSQTLLPYFAGTGENFYTNDVAFRSDYVVLYLAQMQRLAPSPEIVRYYLAQKPEAVISIQGVEYAKIYPNTRRILSNIPPDAEPANTGLGDIIRLAGYKIQPETPKITLYWHALSPLDTNYTISVRAFAAGGSRLLQQDQWPLDGLLPTSQWRQGDYIVDTHTLDISPAEAAGIHQFEIVVYNADTGETLGPPVTIRNGK